MSGRARGPIERIAVAAVLGVAVSLWAAFSGIESGWMGLVWAGSIVAFLAAARSTGAGPAPSRGPRRWLHLLGAALCPVAVRVLNLGIDPLRTHQDEFVTGYFSATQDFARENFFASMPERFEWMASFPKPFFLLQRAFFALFGESALTLRLSVQIYVAIIAVALFLVVEELLDRRAAWAAVVLYSFMAISVYFETLGFSFVAAGAALMVFFYLAIRSFRTGSLREAALAGVACGFCYLTYYGSYMAYPLLIGFAILAALSGNRRAALRSLLVSSAGTVLVVAPFLAWDLAAGDSYLRRFKQVALTTGTLSPYRRAVLGGARQAPIIVENLRASLKAFVEDGVGGSGGYDFGRLEPFDGLSLAFLAVGAAAGLYLVFRRRELVIPSAARDLFSSDGAASKGSLGASRLGSELLLVFAVVLAAFLGGVALTIPPPAYHRFTVALPFLAILMAVPFWLLGRAPGLSRSARAVLCVSLLVLYASINERRFVEAVARDKPSDDLRAVALLRQRFGDRNPVMALARFSDLDRTLYFYDRPPRRPVARGFHRWLLRDIDPSRKYVYLTTLPDRWRERFERADPHGRMYRVSWLFGIFAN
ncbi:MAG: glycosyltransferase family 39 protein [Thermoanaerobaculia bacterium]